MPITKRLMNSVCILVSNITIYDHTLIKVGCSFPPPSPSPKLNQVGQLPSCKLQTSLNVQQQSKNHEIHQICFIRCGDSLLHSGLSLILTALTLSEKYYTFKNENYENQIHSIILTTGTEFIPIFIFCNFSNYDI